MLTTKKITIENTQKKIRKELKWVKEIKELKV